ncbi:hypothetical protein EDC04DRAFT_2607748 [Pisolithus marmoratus]|nr:hypothetical protein EDC04DRAFT_2607748 [Pisolithus marmoratus]
MPCLVSEDATSGENLRWNLCPWQAELEAAMKPISVALFKNISAIKLFEYWGTFSQQSSGTSIVTETLATSIAEGARHNAINYWVSGLVPGYCWSERSHLVHNCERLAAAMNACRTFFGKTKADTPAEPLNLATRYFTKRLFGANSACMGWLVVYNPLSLHESPLHETLADQMSTPTRTRSGTSAHYAWIYRREDGPIQKRSPASGPHQFQRRVLHISCGLMLNYVHTYMLKDAMNHDSVIEDALTWICDALADWVHQPRLKVK